MPRVTLRSLPLRAFLVASIFTGSCRTPTGPQSPGAAAGEVGTGQKGKAPDAPGPQGMEDAFEIPKEGSPEGLVFRLSQGKPEAVPYERLPPTQGTPLSRESTDAILKRLPGIGAEAGDEQAFAMRERSLPPPKTAKTIKEAFPPPAPPEVAKPAGEKAGPLEVLRFQPQGDVTLAPFVSVTFSQPMVAVTSVEELAKIEPPVKITPRPPGKWRWLGTRTVMFDAERERFPMATGYTVEIPAGIKSTTGGVLAKAVTFSFATPEVVLQQSWPSGGPHGLDPLLFVAFDQDIDAKKVLGTISIKAGSQTRTPRLATQEEVEDDQTVRALARNSTDKRWLAFKLDAPLPKATTVQVSVGPGTPSAEGPRTTDKAQTFSFRTYDPLAVIDQNCGWDGCRPLDPWGIGFNNGLDTKAWKKEWVTVTPEVPGMKVDASGSWIAFRGKTKGKTTYKVTLSADIKDTFGQTLGKETTIVFKVGTARPTLYTNGGELQVLDPLAKGQVSVFSVNHKKFKIRVHKVAPKDWKSYAGYMRAWYEYRKRGSLPGQIVVDKTIAVDGPMDELIETRVDLGPAFSNGLGHAIIVLEPTVQPRNQWEWQVFHAWVQSTRLGVDALVDQTDLLAWVTDLSTGAAVDGAEVQVTPHKLAAKSDGRGLASFALPSTLSGSGVGMLTVRKGDDTAILPEYVSWWDSYSGWQKRTTGESLAWYLADDRGMYRPGEEVHVKGYLRRIGYDEGGDVGGLAGAANKVDWSLWDPQGNEIAKGSAKVDALGGFDFATKLPGTMNLGTAYMRLTASGGSGGVMGNESYHYVQVQEFRRPEFEVTAEAGAGPHFVGGHAIVTVGAKYYAGGGLPGADTYWNVSAQPGAFSPPGHDDYTFGEWIPWWWWGGRGGYDGGEYYGGRGGGSYPYGGPQATQQLTAKTDGAGDHHLRIDFDSLLPARAYAVRAQSSVMDVNRQAWAATANLLVHPASVYVGLKSERLFVNEGEPIHIDSIVADLDGKLAAGRPVAMRAVREDYVFESGVYKPVEEDAQDCLITSTAKDPARCTFKPKEGGTYKIRAVTKDDKGRKNETKITVWVAGGDLPPTREVSQEKVELVPNKKEYRPGEIAEILVIAPFAGAEGLVTTRRAGVLKTERIKLSGTSYTLKVPIEATHIPNLGVQVDLVGASQRVNDVGERDPKLPKRPAFAVGQLDLSVPPLDRTLSVEVRPEQAKLEPGSDTSVTVIVKDAAGKAAPGSQIAIAIVDESVLALTGYRWPNPVDAFYPRRNVSTNDVHGRQYVVLANPLDAAQNATTTAEGGEVTGAMVGSGPGGGGGYGATADSAAPAPSAAAPANGTGGASRPGPKRAAKAKNRDEAAANGLAGGEAGGAGGQAAPAIQLRTNFDALAFYAPGVGTDAQGRATVKIKVPDNLTRYRITAVAVQGDKHFGKGESVITARLPLMVRPSPPRFLNFGDELEMPVVLQNQTDRPITVEVAARSTNARLKDPLGRKVEVPANDRIEVRFPMAALKPGIARFQVGAVSGRYVDAAELKLPVWTPATTEAFATYGEIDKGAIVQAVMTPGEVWEQFGGLEITTSSTAVSALTDAYLYIYNYPFEYPETLSSEILTITALKDVLAAFKAEGLPAPSVVKAALEESIDRLAKLQNVDGGWGTWRVGEESFPWVSVHAAHALARAKTAGYAIPTEMWNRALAYQRSIEQRIPAWYGIEARRAIIAYSLYARELMGDPDHARAKKLIAEAGGADKLQLEINGFLLFVLSGDAAAKGEVEAIRRHLNNRVDETAAYAHFTTSYTDGQYLLLHSDRRADGIILEALIKDSPKSDLIAKVTKGLLAHRKKGRWANVEESAFVLIALNRYFQVYENITPDFVARVWLGDQYAGEVSYKGRTTEEHLTDVPMRWLVDATAKIKNKTTNLIIQKEGAGRLYYRIGMKYAPKDLKLKPADYGFVVLREYEGVDDPSDVKRDDDGTWRIKAGARVRVRLRMVAPSRRYFVALVDPLPAGLEPMNPALAVTGDIPRDKNPTKGLDQKYWWYWSQYWYQHENMRDERVEAFTTLLWEGVYNYTYVARATTPGNFVVPPTKAEEMYNPETFGRSGSDRVIVQ
jgi:hypothetical protein